MSSDHLFSFRDPTISKTTFNSPMFDSSVAVSLTIRASFEAQFDFTAFCGTPFSFMVTCWKGRRFATSVKLFFAHTSRDAVQFGAMQKVRL